MGQGRGGRLGGGGGCGWGCAWWEGRGRGESAPPCPRPEGGQMTGQPLAGGRRRGRGWGGGGAHRGGRVGGGRGRPFGNGAPQPSPSKHILLFFFCSSSQALHSTHHGWRCVSRRGGGHDPLHPSHACSALGVCGRSKLNRPHAALSRRTTALPRLCPPPRSRSPLLSPTPTPPRQRAKDGHGPPEEAGGAEKGGRW